MNFSDNVRKRSQRLFTGIANLRLCLLLTIRPRRLPAGWFIHTVSETLFGNVLLSHSLYSGSSSRETRT